MIIRRFCETDAQEVSDLIIETLRVSNSKDYTKEEIEAIVSRQQPSDISKRASWTHFYIAEIEGKIVGCGAIGPYWERKDESCFFSIFVLPKMQGKGIGRRIVRTLEWDEYYLRAKRIEIPASITALKFYTGLGYQFKDNNMQPDREGLFRLEKHRNRES